MRDSSVAKDNPFLQLGLSVQVVRPLAVLGITTPTPIQQQAIPLVLSGQDVMGLAQTGTGKTAAFGLPLVDRLLADGEKPAQRSARALILAPTRELVNQIADNLRNYVRKTPVWVSSVVGGQSINPQIKHLIRGTDVLVATPGRLLDLVARKAITLETVRYLVLDEADQMLDLGFIHDLRKIAKMLGTPRQTLLFSATMPRSVEELSRAYLNEPARVEVSPPGKAADKVNQSVWFVPAKEKADLLKTLLAEREGDLSLVFARTKHGAEKLMKQLVAHGFAAVSIHGNKSQGQRDRALKAFKSGEARILVATDVAARGIDIPGVSHVYNFNLPEVPENYVHRIGRTARAGLAGEAVAFCAPDERKLLKQVERLMNIDIAVAGGEDSAPTADVAAGRPNTRRGSSAKRGNRNADGSPKKKRQTRRWDNDEPSATKSHSRNDRHRVGKKSESKKEVASNVTDQSATKSGNDRPTQSKQNKPFKSRKNRRNRPKAGNPGGGGNQSKPRGSRQSNASGRSRQKPK
ncbi:MAG: DEAD/DEAH box helicase [Rhizobiaceae bacterium]